MSDTAQGPGWWIASDGKWYPPEQHPDALAAEPPPLDEPPMHQAYTDQPYPEKPPIEQQPFIEQPAPPEPYMEQPPMQQSPIEEHPFMEQPAPAEPYMEQPPMQQPYMAQTEPPPAGQQSGGAQQFTTPAPGGWDSPVGGMAGAASPPSYSPSPYPSAPVGYAGAGMRQIGKKRSPVAVWLLTLITLDIYFLVWYYKINKEAQAYDSSIKVNPAVAVLAIIPGGFVLVPELVSLFKTGERMKQLQQSSGAQPSSSGILFLILMLIFGIGVIYLQSEINKAWDSAQR
jgi:hypothetical protein